MNYLVIDQLLSSNFFLPAIDTIKTQKGLWKENFSRFFFLSNFPISQSNMILLKL